MSDRSTSLSRSIISTPCSNESLCPAGKHRANRKPSPPARTPASASFTCAIPTAQRLNSCSRPLREPRINTDFRRLREKLFLSVFDRCSSVAKLSVKMSTTFSADEEFAKQLDSEDPLRAFRDKFHLPLGKDGKPLIYFAGNSLGLMPKSAREIVDQELDDWAKLGVDAHLEGKTPWYSYHETLREPTARLISAKPVEVICMNSLTVNLHLMMATFYRPTKSRFKVLMEDPAFPSDTYAIKTQIVHHGLGPKDALILASPRKGEFGVRTEDIVDLIEQNADQLAVVLIAGVNFFTGQLFDIPTITKAAQKRGITVD